jgi:hypothetical protein
MVTKTKYVLIVAILSAGMVYAVIFEQKEKTTYRSEFMTTVNTDTAIFASGCFWGTEYYMKRANGVISTEVGYIGGYVPNPGYRQVCTGTTGHAEAVRVVFDTEKTDYETLCRLFF